MKKIIATVLALALVLACAAAAAEAVPELPEKESMGVLRMSKAFDIRYSTLPDDYTLSVYMQNDMTIIANIETPREDLPRMGLIIAFNDGWADTERLNDVSEEDLQAVRDSFTVEYGTPEFAMRETAYGTKLLTVMAPSGLDAYVYTIYKGHEIEIHLIPGAGQEKLTEADVDRVVAFLSDVDFVEVED